MGAEKNRGFRKNLGLHRVGGGGKYFPKIRSCHYRKLFYYYSIITIKRNLNQSREGTVSQHTEGPVSKYTEGGELTRKHCHKIFEEFPFENLNEGMVFKKLAGGLGDLKYMNTFLWEAKRNGNGGPV